MKLLDKGLFAQLSSQASRSPRLRQHYNLHEGLDDPCQRLIIAIEPDSYVRPHRHLLEPKTECLMGLRGRLALLTFDDRGEILDLLYLGQGTTIAGVEVPAGVWHTLLALEPGSVFFEIKEGPYRPLQGEDFAPWAPEESSREVAAYLDCLKKVIAKRSEKLP